LQVFLVAWLFAHQHQRCARRAFAEDGLRGEFTQRAVAAASGLLLQGVQ